MPVLPHVPADFVAFDAKTFGDVRIGDFLYTKNPITAVERTYIVLDIGRFTVDVEGKVVPSPDERVLMKLLYSSDSKEKDAQGKAMWSQRLVDAIQTHQAVMRAPNEARMREEISKFGGAIEKAAYTPLAVTGPSWTPILIGLGVAGALGTAIWLMSMAAEKKGVGGTEDDDSDLGNAEEEDDDEDRRPRRGKKKGKLRR